MLRTILSISGKPGLFKLVSQGRNSIIVESLLDGKKTPAYSRDKVISLNDIAIYTEEGEKPLREVLQLIFEKESGAAASVDAKADASVLKKYFGEILPSFDRDRVYPTDIKKVIVWYNLLVSKGYTQFNEEVAEEVAE